MESSHHFVSESLVKVMSSGPSHCGRLSFIQCKTHSSVHSPSVSSTIISPNLKIPSLTKSSGIFSPFSIGHLLTNSLINHSYFRYFFKRWYIYFGYRSRDNYWWALRNISSVVPGISFREITAGLAHSEGLISSGRDGKGNIRALWILVHFPLRVERFLPQVRQTLKNLRVQSSKLQ